MKRFFASMGRVLITLIVVVIAGTTGWRLWDYYMNDPWTRDGHVRADVIGVTPDVSGLVSDVMVRDNQIVHRGDVLVRIDSRRFELALQQADAAVAGAKATLAQAQRDAARYSELGKDITSAQKIEQAQEAQEVAQATYQQSLANQGVARLNLERSEIKAPANGMITNLDLNPGDYVGAGKAILALLDTDTLRVEGYFEETKLPRIAVGDPVDIHLMGQPVVITGRVESVAGGIEDRERSDGSNLLANINPTFSWVRLAQRVPIRIALNRLPEGVTLVAGQTATVMVRSPNASAARL